MNSSFLSETSSELSERWLAGSGNLLGDRENRASNSQTGLESRWLNANELLRDKTVLDILALEAGKKLIVERRKHRRRHALHLSPENATAHRSYEVISLLADKEIIIRVITLTCVMESGVLRKWTNARSAEIRPESSMRAFFFFFSPMYVVACRD